MKKSVEAVQWVKNQGHKLLTSVGMQTWEMLLFLAAEQQVAQEIILPVSGDNQFRKLSEETMEQFNLDGSPHLMRRPQSARSDMSRHELMQLRDRSIVDEADILIPLSLRPGGNMSELVSSARAEGRTVDDRFICKHVTRETPLAYKLPESMLSAEISSFSENYLIHWTRSSNGAWPIENKSDFYRAIVKSDNYPRGAYDTLRNILLSGRIAASSQHMSGNRPCVSFSSLRPVDMVPLMRWRARYRQMAFEPYGLGIRRDVAERADIGAVKYFDRNNTQPPAGSPSWQWQSVGIVSHWPDEQEFRCLGDFELSQLDRDTLLAFCPTEDEARMITRVCGVRAMSFL